MIIILISRTIFASLMLFSGSAKCPQAALLRRLQLTDRLVFPPFFEYSPVSSSTHSPAHSHSRFHCRVRNSSISGCRHAPASRILLILSLISHSFPLHLLIPARPSSSLPSHPRTLLIPVRPSSSLPSHPRTLLIFAFLGLRPPVPYSCSSHSPHHHFPHLDAFTRPEPPLTAVPAGLAPCTVPM